MIAFPVNRHRLWQLAADALLIVAAWELAFILRFDHPLPRYYRELLSWQVVALVLAIKLATFVVFGFYNRWWRYVSTRDMWGAARGVAVACLLAGLVLYAFRPEKYSAPPRSILALDFLLLLAFVAGTRLLARTLDRAAAGRPRRARQGGARRRSRRRGPAPDPGDAPQPAARLYPDRSRRRRSAEEGPADSRRARARHHRRPGARPARQPAGRGADRDAVRAGRSAAQDRRDDARRGHPVKTLPAPARADLRRRQPRRADSPGAGRGRPRARAGRGRPRRGLGLRPRSRRARHGRRRARSAPSSAASSRGSAPRGWCSSSRASRRCTRSSASSSTSATSRPRSRCSPTAATGTKMRQVFERYQPAVVFHAAAYKHVPMLEANPLQAVTNNVLATRVIAEVAVEFGVDRFVLHLDRQGGEPEEPARPVEGGLRMDRRVVRAARRRRDALRRRSLRQRARLVRLGDPDLPPPDRARRPRHGDEQGDDAVLHDDPRGRLARRCRPARSATADRCTSSTWASPSRSTTSPSR